MFGRYGTTSTNKNYINYFSKLNFVDSVKHLCMHRHNTCTHIHTAVTIKSQSRTQMIKNTIFLLNYKLAEGSKEEEGKRMGEGEKTNMLCQ